MDDHYFDGETMKGELLKKLDYLDYTIVDQHLIVEKSQALHRTLMRVKNIMSGGTLEEVRSHTPKIGVKIAFFSDIDSPDHNGVITASLVRAFESRVPFITTKSVFLELGRTDDFNFGLREDTLTREGRNWVIYEQIHPEHGAGFLVFIPIVGEMEDIDILQLFDLATDGTLKRITSLDVFSPPEQKTKFDAFGALFTKTPRHSKLIYLNGHGGFGSPVAALSSENYTKFLSLLSEQKCQGLIISSCYSGGRSALVHIDQEVKFPVITHSIGDTPSTGEQPALHRLSSYFDAFARFVESGNGMTILKFRELLQKIEGNEAGEKNSVNHIQIYFPASKDSPIGFRPVGEGGDSFSLTYQVLRKETIEQSKIQITQHFLEVHPVMIDVPLIFENQNPIMLSMVPGHAHHYIKEIRLKKNTLRLFLDENGLWAKQAGLEANKLFLIEKFIADNQSWDDVAIFFDQKGQRSLYLENGQHYSHSSDQMEPIPISDFEYGIRLNHWLDETKASKQAIRQGMGGQQSEETVQKALLNHTFGGNALKKKFGHLITKSKSDNFTGVDLSRLLSKLKGYSKRDKKLLVDHLLRNDKELHVQVLIELEFIPFDLPMGNEPLIFYALRGGYHELFYYLLDKTEVSLRNYKGVTLLHVATGLSNKEAVKKLLLCPGIEINCKTDGGWTPISLTSDAEIFSMLKNKSADMNISIQNPLSNACEFASIEKVRNLLELGFNPNFGQTSPLFHAIRRVDPEMVKLLLDYGANPFLALGKDKLDNPYPMPILEASRRCSSAIVRRMLGICQAK